MLGKPMTKTILRLFATSLAFVGAAIAISVFMWAVEATGHELVPGHQVEDWFKQGSFIVMYALLAGLLVDTIRWLTAVAWVPTRERLGQASRKRHSTEICVSD